MASLLRTVFGALIIVVLFTGNMMAGENNSGSLKADDWPSFRGPSGDGTSPANNVPTNWGPEKNIKWSATLPSGGNSSPIVAGERVFLTCAEEKGSLRHLYCFNRADGKLLWVKTVEVEKGLRTHKTNPYAASTPATDGKYVVVFHGTGGLYCYDMAGKQIWSKKYGKIDHAWGYASSPIIYQGKVILNYGPGRPSFLTALDITNGKEIWRTDEPLAGTGEKRQGGYIGSWATPSITKTNGSDRIICAMPTRVVAYAPMDGKIIWTCEGLSSVRGDLAYSSTHICESSCVAIGGYSGPSIGVKLGGEGDVTKSNQLWRVKSNPQSIGSGIYHDKLLYVPFAGESVIRCMEPMTGKIKWSKSIGNNFWGSMVMADGRIYVTDKQGTTLVFRPNPTSFDLIATNRLNQECNSTPAVCDGQIFIRTYQQLVCIEE